MRNFPQSIFMCINEILYIKQKKRCPCHKALWQCQSACITIQPQNTEVAGILFFVTLYSQMPPKHNSICNFNGSPILPTVFPGRLIRRSSFASEMVKIFAMQHFRGHVPEPFPHFVGSHGAAQREPCRKIKRRGTICPTPFFRFP